MAALQVHPTSTMRSIYAPTNDGYLHAINAKTGAELWSFIPPELLGNLVNLYLDDPSSAQALRSRWLTCEPSCSTSTGTASSRPAGGDKVWIFFGTGRGGDHYYALDVTNRNSPRHMWTLGPTQLPGVGQTWATPSLARVRVSGASQNALNLVLVLSGGYDLTQDNDQVATLYNTDTLGNRIFMVDAETGALLWFAGGPRRRRDAEPSAHQDEQFDSIRGSGDRSRRRRICRSHVCRRYRRAHLAL